MDQQKLLDSVQAWLTSIGLAHPNLPECTSAVIPSSQFLQVVENGCKASNIVLTKEKNPWAKEEPDVSDLPVFKEFLEKITKQGYFNGSPEGSEKYQIKYDKALSKFRAKLQKKAEKKAAEKPNGPTKEEAQLQATELKNKGNACLSKQEFGNALDFYKQAISVCSDGPSSHIFYANAAAALIHMERYEEAAEMCAFSIALNGDYAKSHTRLGYAKIQMNDCQGAIVSLERALELSPNNALATKHLATARNMSSGLNVPSNGGSAQPTGGPLGGAGGMPDFASMMQGLGGGGGGGGGLGAMMQQMMSNPAIMQQAQAMMQNPQMMAMAQNMMQDPNALAQAQAMMSDPNALAQAQAMMSGMGGGGEGGEGGMPDMGGLANMMAQMGNQGSNDAEDVN